MDGMDGMDRRPEGPGTPDEWAAHLATVVPGAGSAGMLDVLDPEKLSRPGRINALRALERHIAGWQARQAHLLAALQADLETELPQGEGNASIEASVGYLADEVACCLKVSNKNAADRLHTAHELDTRLPTTLDLLERGEISWMQARAVAETTDILDPQTAAKVEEAVATKLPGQACGQTRRTLARLVVRLDPDGAEVRHQARSRQREMIHYPAGDGMAHWGAFLPADQAATLDAALDTHAEVLRTQDEATGAGERTLAQRRVDALVDLIVHRPGGSGQNSPAGRGGTVVQVVVPIDTLIGTSTAPAQLKGYGPLTPGQARQLAYQQDSLWRRLLTDPDTGTVIKTDPTTYRPTAETQRHVIARDTQCMFPSCHMPAPRCDLDHIQPFNHHDPPAGGPTTPDNLIPLCRHHHQLKHETHWSIQRDTDSGAVTWTAPTGHTYTTHPHDYRE